MISIIIPIYNAEKYLHRCIDSILDQTNKEWELLLINDGSPDCSGSICDDYALKDSRIKVFHKPNGGVSSARNLGLDNACGEWICFIDADDYVCNNYCEAVLLADTDIVIVENCICDVNGNERYDRPLGKVGVFQNEDYKMILEEYIQYSQFKAPWGKFIRRDKIDNIRFNLGQKIAEDTVFMLDVYSMCSSILLRSEYRYFWQEGDISPLIKYKLPFEVSKDYLVNCFNSYKKAGFTNRKFEIFLLHFFFLLIDTDSPKIKRSWFLDPIILEYNERKTVKDNLPKSYTVWRDAPYRAYIELKIAYMYSVFLRMLSDIKRFFVKHFYI